MKVLYDTSVYISFFRIKKYHDLLSERTYIRYLSPIVMMELLAGANTKEKQRELERFFYTYSKAGRIIQLTANNYYQAGILLAKMSRKRPSLGLSHDVLIALSAAMIGGTLFTANKKDFMNIERYLPSLKIKYV